jgi:cytochrome c553
MGRATQGGCLGVSGSLWRALAALLAVCLGCGAGTTAWAAAPFENTLAQRLLACTSCHGPQGRAGPDGYYPRLAGKPANYLYKQLLDFRDGRRHYPLMAALLEPLTDDYLLEIARHFAALDLPYAAPAAMPTSSGVSAQQLARGQRLAQEGDLARKLPACAACHGAAMTGVGLDVPGLLGLSPDYLNAQLGGWRAGQRAGAAPDCMALVAKRLDQSDIVSVSAWLSTQRVPAKARPTARVAPGVLAALARDHADLACAKVRLPGTDGAAQPEEGPAVVRGAYLARAGHCAGCHTLRGGQPYAGGRAIDTPFGKVYASNLTPDKTHGIGNWSPDDFWQALHEGRSKSGRLLYPAFPYTSYTQVSRADADALWAYLQSLPPAPTPTPAHELRWPFNSQLALRAWRALYFTPTEFAADTRKTAEWNRGAYLVQGLGHCSACHAPRNALGATLGSGAPAGGLIPMQNWYAPALTAASEAGVGHWELADIVALLKTGVSAPGSASGPMAEVVRGSTQYLSDADLKAVAVYLKDLPPHAGPASATPAPPSPPVAVVPGTATSATGKTGAGNTRGAKLYEQHCVQCHGEQGQGVARAYPALAGNRAVTLPSTVNLVQMVLRGGFAPVTGGNPKPFGMPPYQLTLSDSEVAAVLTHVRASWGNRAGAVSELEVSQVRNQTGR